MNASFKLRSKTARQSGCTLLIDPLRTAFGWDVVRIYESAERDDVVGRPEFVIAYDVNTLINQFDISPTKARALSNLFDSLV